MVGLEYWPVVATGVVILIAIAASNRALRGEMSELRRELRGEMSGLRRDLGGEMSELRRELGGRIDGLGERVHGMGKCLTEVRERLARVEGLLEGAWFRPQQSDGKERGGKD